MRTIGMIALALMAAPAFADTLSEVTKQGVVMTAGGAEIEIDFTSDGKFVAAMRVDEGKWRIDGEQLCSTSELTLLETCAPYPQGKKSGDTFNVQTAQGNVLIKIR